MTGMTLLLIPVLFTATALGLSIAAFVKACKTKGDETV